LRWALVAFVVSMVGIAGSVSAQSKNAQSQLTPHTEVLTPAWRIGEAPFNPQLRVHLSEDRRQGFLSFEHGDHRWNSRVFGMWKVLVADLDGDGIDEVILGIWSSISRHKEPLPSRAIWVMRWDGTDLVPLWRGSAMSLPLLDFEVQKADGEAQLKTLETRKEVCFDSTYSWTGFGFTLKDREPKKCLNPSLASTPSEE